MYHAPRNKNTLIGDNAGQNKLYLVDRTGHNVKHAGLNTMLAHELLIPQWKQFYDLLPTLIIVLQEDGHVVYSNHKHPQLVLQGSIYQLFTAKEQQAFGHTLAQLTPLTTTGGYPGSVCYTTQDELTQYAVAVLSDQIPEDSAHPDACFQMHISHYSTSAVPSHDDPPLYVVTVQDISKQRQAQQSSQTDQLLFKQLFEHSLIGMGLTDLKTGQIFEVNQTACDMLGLTYQEFTSITYHKICHPDDLHEHQHRRTVMIDGSTKKINHEKRLIRKDGRIVHTIFKAHPVLSEDNTPCCVFVQFIDITKYKVFEENLYQRTKEQYMGTFAANMAHELNNHLTPILGYTDMVLSMDLDPFVLQCLQDVLLSTKRAAELSRKMLNYSRMGEGRRKQLVLHRVLDEAVSMVRIFSKDRNVPIQLEKYFESTCPPVWTDELLTFQSFINLCKNAVQAMEKTEQAQLKVTLSEVDIDNPKALGLCVESGKYAKVCFKDNGCGMTQETARQIFEPYFTTKGAGKGTGLGLAMVKDMIRDNGGDITVMSELGVGTEFTLYLPCLNIQTRE